MPKSNSNRTHQVYGINGSIAVLNNKYFEIKMIDVSENSLALKHDGIKQFIDKNASKVNHIKHVAFKKKYDKKHTQGIVINFEGKIEKDLPNFEQIDGNYCLLIIDNITDPQNFGQIIRTSECAGIDGIIIPEKNSVGITDTVLQVSQGAFCNMPIYSVTNLHQTLMLLKDAGFWSIALENSIHAKKWNELDYNEKIAIVIGSEGYGIKPLLLKSCDFQATIPMQGITTSLNVSASVAAIVFERLRQIK